ncbi:MAG: cupin domain-containing protein [Thermodesulfovibrionales bacterium]|nr:cupin domain-containing protein [Thermodesulfovibrionales bacterium]
MGISPYKMVKDAVSKSKIIRHKKSFSWNSIKTESYKKKSDDWADIKRKVIIGSEKDNSSIHLRYFEINKGGFSSLEFHKHEHIVICIRGSGKVRIDNKSYIVKPLDVIFTSANSIHQFQNPYDEPFGFFCIVKAKRDKPKIVHQKGEKEGFVCDLTERVLRG